MKKKTILIVDDTAVNRLLLETMLHGEQVDVMSASSGEEGLSMMRERRPDLVLLDIMMPGMNGLDVARRMKADPGLASIPVIILSALDDDATRRRAKTVGANGFLGKPVRKDALTELIRQLTGLALASNSQGE